MARFPVLSGKDIVKALVKIGYRIVRQRGSHIRLACSRKKSITVPSHKTIGKGLLRKILRDAEVSSDTFRKLI